MGMMGCAPTIFFPPTTVAVAANGGNAISQKPASKNVRANTGMDQFVTSLKVSNLAYRLILKEEHT
jgi:hypothetical protein